MSPHTPLTNSFEEWYAQNDHNFHLQEGMAFKDAIEFAYVEGLLRGPGLYEKHKQIAFLDKISKPVEMQAA